MGALPDSSFRPSCSSMAVKMDGPPSGGAGLFPGVVRSGVHLRSTSNSPARPVLSSTFRLKILERELARMSTRWPVAFRLPSPIPRYPQNDDCGWLGGTGAFGSLLRHGPAFSIDPLFATVRK